MNRNSAIAGVIIATALVLTGCTSSDTRVSDDTTPVPSTSPSEAATSAPRTTNAPSSPAVTDNTPTPSITKIPRPVNTASKPDKNSGASKPTKSVIPCGMMDSETKEIGKCPPPVTPTKIVIGESYPWFPVAPGKLAEPWGITGELLYANDFVTLLKITPSEIVIVSDLFSIRGLTRIIGATSAEVENNKSSTFVKFYCNGEKKSGVFVKHYNNSNIVPASLWVLYKEEISEIEINC